MLKKIAAGGVAIALGFLLVTNPVVADAAKQITGKDVKNGSLTGKDVKNNSLTGKDIKENSLAKVPKAGEASHATSADSLTVAKSGTVMSGVFSAAAPNPDGTTDYLGFAITYPRPLAEPIANDHIIDTVSNPDPVHCPGAGKAARGYLCLYNEIYYSVTDGYGYSEEDYLQVNGTSIGVVGYYNVTGEEPYIGGIWTVNAP